MVAQMAPRSQTETPMNTERQPPSSMIPPKKSRAPKLKAAAHTMVSKCQMMASVRFWRAVCADDMDTV